MRMGCFGMLIAQELIDEVMNDQKSNEDILIRRLA
jgi:hypothetical protein